MSYWRINLACLWGMVGQLYPVEYREVQIAGKKATVCKVDLKKEKLRLFHRDDAGMPLKSFEALSDWLKNKGQKLKFAMNGGMYHGDFSAVGLSVVDGVEQSPLNLQMGEGNFFLKPNGVFLVTDAGAKVVESSEYLEVSKQNSVTLATQSGPLLLRHGKIHPVFNPQSQNKLIRNGVWVRSPMEVFFVISEEPVTFYELASYFRDVLRCPDALFFGWDRIQFVCPRVESK